MEKQIGTLDDYFSKVGIEYTAKDFDDKFSANCTYDVEINTTRPYDWEESFRTVDVHEEVSFDEKGICFDVYRSCEVDVDLPNVDEDSFMEFVIDSLSECGIDTDSYDFDKAKAKIENKAIVIECENLTVVVSKDFSMKAYIQEMKIAG